MGCALNADNIVSYADQSRAQEGGRGGDSSACQGQRQSCQSAYANVEGMCSDNVIGWEARLVGLAFADGVGVVCVLQKGDCGVESDAEKSAC